MTTIVEEKVLTPSEQAVADFMVDTSTYESTSGIASNAPIRTKMPDGSDLGTKVAGVDTGMWFTVYNTRTGRKHRINAVHRPFLDPTSKQAWKWPDGTMMFLSRPVKMPPPIEGYKCLLHTEHPDRASVDKWGLVGRRCSETSKGKEHIPSELELRRHMERKHKDEWAVIQEARAREERELDRNLQREFLAAMKQNAAAQELERLNAKEPYSETCEECGEVFRGSVPVAAGAKMRGHMRKQHAEVVSNA